MDGRVTSVFSPVMRRARVLYQLAVDLGYVSAEEEEGILRRYQDAMRDMPHLGFLDWVFIFNVLAPPEVDEVATRFEETPLQCADCEEIFFGAHVDLMDDGLPCPNCTSQTVSVAQDISEWRARVLPQVASAMTDSAGVPISPIPGRALADDPPEPSQPDEPSFEDFAKGLEAGMRVGRCVVEAFVARGGMGMVYRGHLVDDASSTVALKVLHTRLTSNETLIARFREEARALSGLKSPHIVQVLEHGEVAKHCYLLMEWLEGESLAQRMHRLGVVGVRDALDAAEQTCRALEVAHADGIIHRDVKPDNILLMPNGLIKLVDFGLSKNTRTDMRLSQAGTYVGTPAYLAPEQLGDTVTPLADLYALACSLYHVLTGWLPFQGQDTAEVLQMHLQEPFPRTSALNPRVPAELDELLVRMAQKKPSRRPQSVGEVAEAFKRIRELVEGTPAVERRPTGRGQRPGQEPRVSAQEAAQQDTQPLTDKPARNGAPVKDEPPAAAPSTHTPSRKHAPTAPPKPRSQGPRQPRRPRPPQPKLSAPPRTGREPRPAPTFKQGKAVPRTSTTKKAPGPRSRNRATTATHRRTNHVKHAPPARTRSKPTSKQAMLVAAGLTALVVVVALLAWLI